jgi:heme/copper-type cytochrome/quinol oxidase subunit 3
VKWFAAASFFFAGMVFNAALVAQNANRADGVLAGCIFAMITLAIGTFLLIESSK